MRHFPRGFALMSRPRMLYFKRSWHFLSFMSIISTDIFPKSTGGYFVHALYMKVTVLQCLCIYLHTCWLKEITKEGKSVQLRDWFIIQSKNHLVCSSADANTRWIQKVDAFQFTCFVGAWNVTKSLDTGMLCTDKVLNLCLRPLILTRTQVIWGLKELREEDH